MRIESRQPHLFSHQSTHNINNSNILFPATKQTNMFQLRRSVIRGSLRRRIHNHISVLRRYIKRLLHHFLICSGSPPLYRRMLSPPPSATELVQPVTPTTEAAAPHFNTHDMMDSDDLVSLKISLLGDCHIGKTTFLVKYVGDEIQNQGQEKKGLNLNQMDKTLLVGGARISYSIFEVAGDEKSEDQIPMACKDSVAILIMFDLTSRCTLNSVIGWYKEARKWNKTAIPVLIGTKFDDFIQLPIDMQWTIASQARAYAKALDATLFFSSATYNINVNKIFKFITAKLFDLPWKLQRNLTVGEPIIDF